MKRSKRAYLDDDGDDTSGVARDGEFLRVPMMICDGASFHQPGYRSLPNYATDVQRRRREARDSYVASLKDAWRNPGRDAAPDVGAAAGYSDPDEGDPNEKLLRGHLREPNENEQNQARRDRAWAQYKDQLGRAWQNPGRTNPNRANEVERLRRQTTHER